MLKVDCKNCKEEVIVNMHMSQPTINFYRDEPNDRISWSAHVKGRAICPTCGVEIIKRFESEICLSDVVDLALRRERHV